MKKILITGGAGFVGSHIIDRIVELYPDSHIVVLDKMTYAADVMNIIHHIKSDRIKLIVGDVSNIDTCKSAVKDMDLVIHAAAESHVDNSFGNSLAFSQTNVLGTHSLLEACRIHKTPRIIHVSTDEVYGEIVEGEADESHVLLPTNPYSASKAAAEMIVQGYLKSFDLPIVTLRANNIYGVRQFPEKIIPKFMVLLMQGKKMTLHGTGENTRHFLSVYDMTKALQLLIEKGQVGEFYNIGSEHEYKNIEIANMICDVFDVNPEENISFVEDRPFNDARYAINWDKISQLGWAPEHRLKEDIRDMARWYMENFKRFVDLDTPLVNKPNIN